MYELAVRRLPLKVGEKPSSILVNIYNPELKQYECVSPFFDCVGEGADEEEAALMMTQKIATEQLVKATSRVRGKVKPEIPTSISVRLGLKAKDYLIALAEHYNITQVQMLDWLVFIQMAKMGAQMQAEIEGR